MSNTTPIEPIDFNAHYAGPVIQHFMVDPENTRTIEAIKFTYKCLRDGYHRTNSLRSSFNDVIVKETIDFIKFRYDLFKNYAEHFFPKCYKPDMDALVIAVICDSFIDDANSPIDPTTDEDMRQSDHEVITTEFSSPLALHYACDIYEGARQIAKYGMPDEYDPHLFQEALFLAHINVFQTLREFEDNFEHMNDDELREVLDHDFKPARTFVFRHNIMGEALLDFMDEAERRITACLEPQTAPKPRDGHLTLVKG